MTATTGPRLGVTLYSFTPEFHAGEYTFEALLRKVGELGLGPGIEFVGFENVRGFPRIDADLEQTFKSALDRYGLVPACLDGQLDLGIRRDRLMTPDEAVAYIEAQVEAAKILGFPVLRVQYGGFYEIAERLVPAAERAGVKLGVEIHSPHSVRHPTMQRLLELYDRLDCGHLGFIPDFGASATDIPHVFLDGFQARGVPADVVELVTTRWRDVRESGQDPLLARVELRDEVLAAGNDDYAAQFAMFAFEYFGHQPPAAWAEIMPYVFSVHAKFFEIDENGTDPAVPHEELVTVFRDGGYDGFMCSEYEGWQWEEADERLSDGFAMVAAHQRLYRRILGQTGSATATST